MISQFFRNKLGVKANHIPLVISSAVSMLSIVVLVGWIFKIEAFKSLFFPMVAMKFNTTLNFFLSGVALFLLCSHQASKDARKVWAARILSLVVGLISCFTLFEYIAGYSVGIDEFFVLDSLSSTLVPGRPSLNTCICFLLLTGALVSLSAKKTNKIVVVAQFFAISIFFLSLGSSLLYFLNVPFLSERIGANSTAVSTIVGLVALVFAIMSFHAKEGFSGLFTGSSISNQFARRLFFFIFFVTPLLTWMRIRLDQVPGVAGTSFPTFVGLLTYFIVFTGFVWVNAKKLDEVEKNKNEGDRKVREQELLIKDTKKNFSDYKYAIDCASIVAVTNSRGIITYVNDKFCEISEYSAAELLGKDHRILNSGYHSKQFFENLWSTISTGKVWEGEIRNLSKSGRVHWVYTTIVPFVRGSGEIYQYMAIRKDITKRKIMQEALEKSEFKFRRIFNSNMFGIIFWTEKGDVYDANNTFLEMLGFSREDLEAGRIDWKNLTPDEYRKDDLVALEDLRTKGLCQPYDKEFIKKTGGRIAVTVAGCILPDVVGTGGLGFIVDISAKKNVEKERSDLILREQLAQKAVKLKSDFLASMSHEIRTPLSAIIGLSDLLLEKPVNQEQEEIFKVIQNSSKTLKRLVDDVLDLSKLEAGKVNLKKEPFDLTAILEEAYRELQWLAHSKHLRYEIRVLGDPLPRVLGDSLRVRQVVTNLLSNAIKFTNSGSVSLSAQAIKKIDNLHYIQFEVRDTGIGLEPDELRNLFEPFSQTTTTIENQGTGLGLSISKKLVHLMHGEIGLETSKANGSIFWIRIPFEIAPSSNDVQIPKIDVVYSNAPFITSILVVEDAMVNQKVMHMLLASIGIYSYGVFNGKEALLALERGQYSLILMDCNMPEMDGYSATKYIRENPIFKDLPIIAMTASVMPGDREKCLAAGMNDCLPKPISKSDLINCLRRWGIRCGSDLRQEVETTMSQEHVLEKYPSINWSRIHGLREVSNNKSEEVIKNVLDFFWNSIPKKIDLLEKNLVLNQKLEAAEEAHSLKSSICYLGLERMMYICTLLEDLSRSSGSIHYDIRSERLIKKLREEYSSVIEDFKKSESLVLGGD